MAGEDAPLKFAWRPNKGSKAVNMDMVQTSDQSTLTWLPAAWAMAFFFIALGTWLLQRNCGVALSELVHVLTMSWDSELLSEGGWACAKSPTTYLAVPTLIFWVQSTLFLFEWTPEFLTKLYHRGKGPCSDDKGVVSVRYSGELGDRVLQYLYGRMRAYYSKQAFWAPQLPEPFDRLPTTVTKDLHDPRMHTLPKEKVDAWLDREVGEHPHDWSLYSGQADVLRTWLQVSVQVALHTDGPSMPKWKPTDVAIHVVTRHFADKGPDKHTDKLRGPLPMSFYTAAFSKLASPVERVVLVVDDGSHEAVAAYKDNFEKLGLKVVVFCEGESLGVCALATAPRMIMSATTTAWVAGWMSDGQVVYPEWGILAPCDYTLPYWGKSLRQDLRIPISRFIVVSLANLGNWRPSLRETLFDLPHNMNPLLPSAEAKTERKTRRYRKVVLEKGSIEATVYGGLPESVRASLPPRNGGSEPRRGGGVEGAGVESTSMASRADGRAGGAGDVADEASKADVADKASKADVADKASTADVADKGSLRKRHKDCNTGATTTSGARGDSGDVECGDEDAAQDSAPGDSLEDGARRRG